VTKKSCFVIHCRSARACITSISDVWIQLIYLMERRTVAALTSHI